MDSDVTAPLIFCATVAVYLLPAIVACTKRVACAWNIFLLNFFLGWTVIGWLAALVMAIKADTEIIELTNVVASNAGEEIVSILKEYYPEYVPESVLCKRMYKKINWKGFDNTIDALCKSKRIIRITTNQGRCYGWAENEAAAEASKFFSQIQVCPLCSIGRVPAAEDTAAGCFVGIVLIVLIIAALFIGFMLERSVG